MSSLPSLSLPWPLWRPPSQNPTPTSLQLRQRQHPTNSIKRGTPNQNPTLTNLQPQLQLHQHPTKDTKETPASVRHQIQPSWIMLFSKLPQVICCCDNPKECHATTTFSLYWPLEREVVVNRGVTRLPSECDYLPKYSSFWRLSIENHHKRQMTLHPNAISNTHTFANDNPMSRWFLVFFLRWVSPSSGSFATSSLSPQFDTRLPSCWWWWWWWLAIFI